MLLASAEAQQMCLSSATSPGPEGAVTFDDISTLGTSTIEESLVDVSLANSNTTGEIKIKQWPNRDVPGYNDNRGGNYFYLLIDASQSRRFSRKARLFIMVNGKVPLSGFVSYGTGISYNGVLLTESSLRVVRRTNEPSMPLGMMEFSEEEVTFEAMEFIHHGDTLR